MNRTAFLNLVILSAGLDRHSVQTRASLYYKTGSGNRNKFSLGRLVPVLLMHRYQMH